MGQKTRNKIDIHLLWIMGVFALIILASSILLVFVSRKDAALQGADQIIRLSSQAGFTCEYAEAQKLYPYGDGVLKITTDRIAYLTLSGNEVFSSFVSYNNPRAVVLGERAVVIDINGYGVTMINTEGVIYSKPVSSKIKSASLSQDGMCAVITEAEDSFGSVLIFDKDGNIISSWTSYYSGYPIAAAFDEDSSHLAVTTLNTSGAVYEPFVRVFSIIDNNGILSAADYALYSIDGNDVFSSVMYIDDILFTFSANAIYAVNNDNLIKLDNELGNVNYVAGVGSNLFVIYSDGANQLNRLCVMDTSGNEIYNSDVGTEVNAIGCSENRYVLCVDSRIFVFDEDGNLLSDISVDEDILRIGFIGNNKLAVVSAGGVHTIDY